MANEAQTFSREKIYQLFFRGSSLEIFIDGIKKYQLYLEKFKGDGNDKLNAKIEGLNRLISWLSGNLKSYSSDWDMNIISLHGETLILLKSTLPYLLEELNQERDVILSKNPPLEAIEGTDRKIGLIKNLMNTGLMSKVPSEEIMGKVSERREPSSSVPIIIDGELQRTLRKISNDTSENDRAIDDALTILEDRIRNVSKLLPSDYGERLITKALHPNNGVLIISDIANEQDGFWKTYDGFLKAFKNPSSHRRIKYTKNEAIQIVQFADYLIGLLQKARQRQVI